MRGSLDVFSDLSACLATHGEQMRGCWGPCTARDTRGFFFLSLRCSSPSLFSRVFLPIHSHPGRARRQSCRQLDAPRFESCADHRRRIHPSPWPPTARGALVALFAGNWTNALSMVTIARASLVHHDQAAIGHGSDESVLEPEGWWNQIFYLLNKTTTTKPLVPNKLG